MWVCLIVAALRKPQSRKEKKEKNEREEEEEGLFSCYLLTLLQLPRRRAQTPAGLPQ